MMERGKGLGKGGEKGGRSLEMGGLLRRRGWGGGEGEKGGEGGVW